jgi:hypothetical protein
MFVNRTNVQKSTDIAYYRIMYQLVQVVIVRHLLAELGTVGLFGKASAAMVARG